MLLSSRFEILNSFESSMRMLLRQRSLSNKENFSRDMMIVYKYVGSIKEGVFLAQEIKINFECFLPKLEREWKDADYKPLINATEKYAERLANQLQKQQELFEEVSLIISSLDILEGADAVKTTVKSTLIPITLEFKIIKILCNIHNILFRKDQHKLNEAIEEFLLEFRNLEECSSQPLLQLRCLIEQIKISADMSTDADIIRIMLQKVVDIAHNFIQSFCGD
uniref:Uncharacterized protein n=1 Tax=viral metagenome TaxID=1070528 RepID=A0A6C0KTD7_9ZZZZ